MFARIQLNPVATPVAVSLLSLGCAFHDPTALPGGACARNDDCAEYRRCNPISHQCELVAPQPVLGQLAGPFDLELYGTGGGELSTGQQGGMNLAAGIPALTFDEVEVPPHDIFLNATVLLADVGALIQLDVKGQRHASHEFQELGFYRLTLSVPPSALQLGRHEVETFGDLLFCRAYPADSAGAPVPGDPYHESSSYDGCVRLFRLDRTGISVTTRSSELLTGYLVAPLVEDVGNWEGIP